MRTFTFLLSLLLINTAISAGNPPQHRRLDGSWYHSGSDNWIEIRDEGRYISVMGLPPQGKARIFEQEWKGIYLDKKGNKITLENRNTLLYNHRKSGHIIEFHRHDQHQSGAHGHWNNNSPGTYYDHPSKDYEDHNYKDGDFIEGSWIADKSIVIAMVKTRDGLKAKYSGTTRWVSYQADNNRKDEFVDDKGNRYVFHSHTSATWYSNDHRNQVIPLKKISDEVKY